MALRVIYEFPVVGATADGHPLDGPGVLGGPYPDDTLSDGNTATGVRVNHYVGPSGVIFNAVEGFYVPTTDDPDWYAKVSASQPDVYARVSSDKEVQNIVLEPAGTGMEAGRDFSVAPIRTTDGWFYKLEADAWESLLLADATAPHVSAIRVQVPLERVDTTAETFISEVWLVTAVPGDAPPCRLFPRADGLGVGGGRHFPPPKSRQRSARRFGYY